MKEIELLRRISGYKHVMKYLADRYGPSSWQVLRMSVRVDRLINQLPAGAPSGWNGTGSALYVPRNSASTIPFGERTPPSITAIPGSA